MPLQSYRPRSASEIVDAALQLFRRHYTPLVATMAVGYLPLVVLFIVFRDQLDLTPALQNPNTPPLEMLGRASKLFAVSGVMALWFYIVSGVLALAVSSAYVDDRVDVTQALRRGFARAPFLLGAGAVKILWMMTGLLAGALIGAVVGFVAGLLLGLITTAAMPIAVTLFTVVFMVLGAARAYARLVPVPATTVLEPAGLGLRRAWRLTSGNAGRVLGTMVLAWVIYLIGLAIVASIGLGVMHNLLVYQLLGAAYNILAFPFVAVTQTLVYYDLRIRKEGLDLELMARQAPAAAMVPSPL